MRNAIREAIFEHEMFEPQARRSAYGIDHIRRTEATWPYKADEIQNEVGHMTSEGLLELSSCPMHWSATRKGLQVREQLWQVRGLRHPSLGLQESPLQNLVLALLMSGHHNEIVMNGYDTFIEDTLPIFLWKHPEQAITDTLENLIRQGLVERCDYPLHPLESNLFVKADGRIKYAAEVVPQLALIPPMSILAPFEEVVPPFQEIELTATFADNLRYRWEEVRRCTQAEAWLAASILYGSDQRQLNLPFGDN